MYTFSEMLGLNSVQHIVVLVAIIYYRSARETDSRESGGIKL